MAILSNQPADPKDYLPEGAGLSDLMDDNAVRGIQRWLKAAQRQLDIACDNETPGDIRQNAAEIAARARRQAIRVFPEPVQRAAAARAADSGVSADATASNPGEV